MAMSPSYSYLVARNLQKRRASREGAGAISQVHFKGAGFYESTGTDVAVRTQPKVTTPWGENVIGTLMVGDVVKASGLTQSSGGIEFAEVSTVFDAAGKTKPSWVATMYLQPSSKTVLSGGGGGPAPGPQGGGGGDGSELAESSIFSSGLGLAFGLLLVAVAIYFIAK